jgi:hypothetical protein
VFSDDHLSPRDRAIVDGVVRFGQLTATQIERLYFNDGSEASRTGRRNRALRRLVKWRTLGRIQERVVGGWQSGSHGYVYTSPGSTAQLRNAHTLNVAELFVRLTEAPSIEVIQFDPEPRIDGLSVVPDADVRVQMPKGRFHFYAEVEFSAKSDERVRDKLKVYERAARNAAHFPLVLYLAKDETRRRAIQRVIDGSSQRELFQAILFEDATSFLVG